VKVPLQSRSHGWTITELVESLTSFGFLLYLRASGADGGNSRPVSCFRSKSKWRA